VAGVPGLRAIDRRDQFRARDLATVARCSALTSRSRNVSGRQSNSAEIFTARRDRYHRLEFASAFGAVWLARDGLHSVRQRGCVHSLATQRRDKCNDAASRFLGQCAILGSATGTCCASGGPSWSEVEAPSLPNRCLHLAQTAGASLKFEGALFSVQPLAPLHLPMVRAEVPVQVQRCLCSLPQ
jgi:hypothetical protein